VLMKKVYVILFICAAALIPDPLVHTQGHHIMTATITTESGTRTVEIRYFATSEEWAKDVFKTIREGFPLLEKKIGVPCPVTYDILVIEATKLGAGVGGMNRGAKGLVVPTGTSTGTIVHELCHYWFGWHPYLQWSKWILEGFAEAYTISVLRELDHPEGYDHWYSRLNQYEWAKAQIGDKPLSEVGYVTDFEDPRVAVLYSKGMVYCTWLVLFFGEETMHTINERIIFTDHLRSEDYQAVAEEVTGQQLDWLFSGWVYPGEYYYEGKSVSFEWFAGDGDKDGIKTFEEIKKGSSPFITDTDRDGLPDGYEIELRTDLKNSDTDNDGLKDGEEVSIIIDGKNTEWEKPVITDEKDSKSETPQDIKAVYYAADNNYVYFMIECYNNLNTAHHTGILINVDDNNSADFAFLVSFDYLFLGVWEQDGYTEFYDPESLKGTFVVADEVIEFRIPKRMRRVRFPTTIYVWGLEYSLADGVTVDKTYADSVVLDATVESTNPLNPDSDYDGFLDGEDQNPLSADVREEGGTDVPENEESTESAEVTGAPDTEVEVPELEVTKIRITKVPDPESESRGAQKVPQGNLRIAVGVVLLILIVAGYLLKRRSHPAEQPEKRICPQCGYDNEADDNFCELCGELLW